MAKQDDYVEFLQAKDQCVENLLSLKSALVQCVDEKGVEMQDSLYDQITVRLDGTPLLESWEELGLLIDQAKIVEEEIDAWLSIHGLTSYSLSWPSRPEAH
jgi:hypothetical protein